MDQKISMIAEKLSSQKWLMIRYLSWADLTALQCVRQALGINLQSKDRLQLQYTLDWSIRLMLGNQLLMSWSSVMSIGWTSAPYNTQANSTPSFEGMPLSYNLTCPPHTSLFIPKPCSAALFSLSVQEAIANYIVVQQSIQQSRPPTSSIWVIEFGDKVWNVYAESTIDSCQSRFIQLRKLRQVVALQNLCVPLGRRKVTCIHQTAAIQG